MKISMMKINALCLVLIYLIGVFGIGNCESSGKEGTRVGGVSENNDNGNQNDAAEIENIARFAVQEHNNKENSVLEFVRVTQAKQQVVSGKMYNLVLEVNDAGTKKMCEAKVFVKPWMNFKQLESFKINRSE
ncbi:protease inhibitor [Lithospermum erythrorhizon]|uniref:Cysteine proteinase inhibitor n=1 Tax=Lithospermum erythrorhizon TaxID=34254 RepID=A0AAV3RKH0_LITER